MSQKITYNTSIIDGSITNPSVERSTANDNTTPFSFLDFITITKIDYTPEEYNSFYITYLKEWANVKNSIIPSERVSYVDSYVQFLKEVVLTYSTNQEKKFLSKLDFNNPSDLDIAIPFFVEKIRQIIIFYKSRRDDAQYTVERNKLRGNSLSIEKAIYEKIYQYVFAAQDAPSYTSLGITLSGIQNNLKINIEEFADVYGNYFEPPPILRGRSQLVNLDTAALPINDDPNYIVVDDFDTVSGLYDDSKQQTGDRDVFQASTGISTGKPVVGTIISNGAITGVNSTPESPITNPSEAVAAGNTFSNIPPGTPLPAGDITNSTADLFLAPQDILNSNIQDLQAAALTTSLSSGVFTDFSGNIISDNTNAPSVPGVFINQPVSNVPEPEPETGFADQLYNTNTNPVDPKLYFPGSDYGEIFGSTAFLEGLPLIANVDLQYDPICDPNNPIDIAKRDQEEKTGLNSKQIVDLKKKLLSKYIGVDFHYIDTTGGIPVSGILVAADLPSGNVPNIQRASTPTVPGTRLLNISDFPPSEDIQMLGIGTLREDLAALSDTLAPTNTSTTGIDALREELLRSQRLNIIDNRTNRDLTFGGDDVIANYGFEDGDDDRSGTYYASNIVNTPLETVVRDNSLTKSISLLRNVGLFFKPDKIGLFKLNSKNFTFSIDYNKLKTGKIYFFPDPNVYGNVSVNSQSDYPVVYVYDHRPDVKNVSTGFAQGDPRISMEEQAFGPYYAKEQNTEKQLINTDGLNLNFTDLYNQGYITKIQYDVFGNEYALFKDEFGQTFRDREELSSDRIVSKVLNGHVFYDKLEGYNFNYDTSSIDGTTIRTGFTTTTTDTINPSGGWQFTLSSHPMTFFFREFILYQELLEETRRLLPMFRDGGRFTFLDNFNLPDPLDGDDIDYPDLSNYYYELLVDAGISPTTVLLPPRPTNMLINVEEPEDTTTLTEFELDLETEQTDADFTIDVSKFLSAGNVGDYDCGYFTDDITLQNDYNYSTNYRYYDIVSENSKTVLSQLSASHDYMTQGERDRLRGQLYVKNQAYSLSQPVSLGLSETLDKYSTSVKNEIYGGIKDVDIIYDTVIVETNSYLIFDKIKYEDGSFQQPGTRNTVFKIVSSGHLNRFSNRFFHEDKRSIVFAIISPIRYTQDFFIGATDLFWEEAHCEEPVLSGVPPRNYRPIFEEDTRDDRPLYENTGNDKKTLTTTQSAEEFYSSQTITLSTGNNKLLVPSIYEYNIKDNTYKKIFPLNTQLQDLSGLFSLKDSFNEVCNFSIVEVKAPKLTYNSLNDMYKLSYIGVDNNNLFHILDYAFYINNDGRVEFGDSRYYKHDKIVRTSDLLSTDTTFISAYKLAGDFTLTNGKIIL